MQRVLDNRAPALSAVTRSRLTCVDSYPYRIVMGFVYPSSAGLRGRGLQAELMLFYGALINTYFVAPGLCPHLTRLL